MDQDETWHGMQVVFCPGHIPLDPAPPPQFSAHICCGQMAAWNKMLLGMEVGLGPGDFVFDGDPATPEKRAHPPPPNFWPMSIVDKQLDG